jgi:hypothetical protein
MRVYTGSAWKATGSAVNGTSIRQSFTATAGQTTFVVAGGYDAGFADVYLNGVKLVNGVDVTITSGTDVVLTTGAVVGDSVDVVAYGAFEVSDTYTQAATNGLLDLKLNAANPSYTGTLTGGTGVVNLGSGQFYKDANGNVGIGTAGPTSGVRADIVSDNTAQQYVNVVKVKTTNTGDYHPAILFENNRGGVANAVKIAMDSATSVGTGVLVIQTQDTGGTFNSRLSLQNNGNLQFNSGYGSVATAYGCRAWANFDGVNLTIRGGGNFSSISRSSTGVYSASFTTAMADTNYCAVGTSGGNAGSTGDDSVVSWGGTNIGTVSGISQIRTLINPSSSGRVNSDNLSIVVFR